jgi:uncharacterized protein (DUF58 family)
VLHALARVEAGGAGSVAAALAAGLGAFRRRGPVFVFSDLYEPADVVGDAVTKLARAGFDVALFHVLDPLERDLDLARETEFVDLEGGERLAADPRLLRRAYRERLSSHVAELRRACASAGAELVEVDTSAPLDAALARYLRERRTRRAAR